MHKLTIKEILQDALICEKYMLASYEQFGKESSNQTLLALMIDNFESTAHSLHRVFREMKDRNLYPVENAELNKIEKAITKLEQSNKTHSDDFK